jgi:hypothetical protein
MSLKIVLGACLLAEATANFVSPGLDKCLDLQAELKDDGTRETLEEMVEDEKTNVQLYECHGDHNQHFEITQGQFRSFSMQGFCLTASAIEDNADVHLEKCEEGNERQQWDLTGDGNVKVSGSEKCLDVKAALKDDGTRENWAEIKEHKTVNVHLYKCHDPEKTERVNQLWGWTPYKHGKPVTAKSRGRGRGIVQEWAVQGLKLSGSTSVTMVSLTGLVAAGLLALGALAGKRMRGSSGEPMASLVAEE